MDEWGTMLEKNDNSSEENALDEYVKSHLSMVSEADGQQEDRFGIMWINYSQCCLKDSYKKIQKILALLQKNSNNGSIFLPNDDTNINSLCKEMNILLIPDRDSNRERGLTEWERFYKTTKVILEQMGLIVEKEVKYTYALTDLGIEYINAGNDDKKLKKIILEIYISMGWQNRDYEIHHYPSMVKLMTNMDESYPSAYPNHSYITLSELKYIAGYPTSDEEFERVVPSFIKTLRKSLNKPKEYSDYWVELGNKRKGSSDRKFEIYMQNYSLHEDLFYYNEREKVLFLINKDRAREILSDVPNILAKSLKNKENSMLLSPKRPLRKEIERDIKKLKKSPKKPFIDEELFDFNELVRQTFKDKIPVHQTKKDYIKVPREKAMEYEFIADLTNKRGRNKVTKSEFNSRKIIFSDGEIAWEEKIDYGRRLDVRERVGDVLYFYELKIGQSLKDILFKTNVVSELMGNSFGTVGSPYKVASLNVVSDKELTAVDEQVLLYFKGFIPNLAYMRFKKSKAQNQKCLNTIEGSREAFDLIKQYGRTIESVADEYGLLPHDFLVELKKHGLIFSDAICKTNNVSYT